MHLGTVTIFLSFIISIILLVLFSLSYIRKKDYLYVTEILFYISGLVITLAVILLFEAFISNRFYFTYVYNYSSKDLSIFYKLTGFWAGQEGTFLLWIFFLFIIGIVIYKKKDDYVNLVMPVIVLIQFFILTILIRQGPFEYIWQTYRDLSPWQYPGDGSGLNPLLQDPWMIIHPPVLFLGYASATIPFAYAIAGLIKKDYSGWVIKAYTWVIFCVITLGIGIFLGAYWAYKVLGWGGYWGWDPVENSSLIPWLIIVALMHGILIQRKKNVLVKTNLVLAVSTLTFVFYGTFLTRSGVLSDFSVHSFSDLGLKGYLVFFIIFFLLMGSLLIIKRYKDIKSSPLEDKFLTSVNSLNYGIILLLIYTVFILIGTSMPIISGLLLPYASSVTQDFYNLLSIPFGILILIILIIATVYRSPFKGLKYILSISVISIIISIFLNIFYSRNLFAFIFIALGFFIVIQNTMDLFRIKSFSVAGSRLAHIGIGFLVVGIITSNMHSYSVQKNLEKGIETEIDSIKLKFTGIKEEGKGALEFTYFKNKDSITEIETPYFFSEKMNALIREPYIDYGFFRDIYISPVEYINTVKDQGRFVIRKGEDKIVEGVKIKFTGFDINKSHMESVNPRLFVKLIVETDGVSYTVRPGIIVKSNNVKESIEAVIPGLKRKIYLRGFDIAAGAIELYMKTTEASPAAPVESALIDVSFKRMVWLVWLGTIFISIGGIAAFRKYYKED